MQIDSNRRAISARLTTRRLAFWISSDSVHSVSLTRLLRIVSQCRCRSRALLDYIALADAGERLDGARRPRANVRIGTQRFDSSDEFGATACTGAGRVLDDVDCERECVL